MEEATIDVERAGKTVRESQDLVEMLEARQLEARQRQVSQVSASKMGEGLSAGQGISPGVPPAQSYFVTQPVEKLGQQTLETQQQNVMRRDGDILTIPAPTDSSRSISGDTQRERQDLRKDPKSTKSIAADQPPLLDEDRLRTGEKVKFSSSKSKKKMGKCQQQQRTESQSDRGGQPSKSLTALTTGEKDQFINQMAKHAAEILFLSKGQQSGLQSSISGIPQAVSPSPFGYHPPGLRLIQSPGLREGGLSMQEKRVAELAITSKTIPVTDSALAKTDGNSFFTFV